MSVAERYMEWLDEHIDMALPWVVLVLTIALAILLVTVALGLLGLLD